MRARQRQDADQSQRAQTRRDGQPARRGAQSQGIGRGAIIGGILTILVAGVGLVWAATHQPPAHPGPTPTLQSLAPAINGIQCLGNEQLVYHIHQRLDLYYQGKRATLPSSIGIPGSEQNPTCYYWIHVHALYPGIIHVESPVAKTFTLGDFFTVWNATKNSTIPRDNSFLAHLQAASPSQITVFYNGKRWTSGYRTVPLTVHALITVEIGKPVVPPGPAPNWAKLGL